ncbi:DUF1761 domain-containing protein [Pseudaestuariivita atlantica]|uniref:DUF1761 domain-containing protein n=1 Tax=Pseudaestuariivita atlantica TaxID=1317121 RepID=A0A0L1JPH5_9RHOB|nr:DUF1761 domain-containing protein [Pseudaestuariivita atlantica]KNG93631.1 hypothetical protein ATO11_10505 [Pseudaestuariivita atlantica]
MGILAVIVAGVAAFAFGAVWYMAMASQWMAASGVPVKDGKPANSSNPVPYITGLIACILVAGMMRHMFVLGGIDTVAKGLVSGLGLGLFIVLPWFATCYAFAARPAKLTMIDGVYVTGGCTVIGIVLTLF